MVNSVTATINGQTHNLTFNSQNGKYEAMIRASYDSSFNQPGGYFPVTVTAYNDSGSVEVTDGSSDFGSSLRLYVRENTEPTIGFVSHCDGASFSSLPIKLTFLAADSLNGQDTGYSGIDPLTISVYFDSKPIQFYITEIYDYGYEFEISVNEASEGSHNIRLIVSDNDGNQAQAQYTIKVDKTAPSLSVLSPYEGQAFSSPVILIRGFTSDGSGERPVVRVFTNDGFDQGDANFVSDTDFEKEITLLSGNNRIIVTSTDSSGNTTEISRNVIYDNSLIIIKSVTLSSDIVNAGENYIISVEVE